MTRLDRLLILLDKYDYLAACHFERNQHPFGHDILMALRQEKEKLRQELIENGYRRKN